MHLVLLFFRIFLTFFLLTTNKVIVIILLLIEPSLSFNLCWLLSPRSWQKIPNNVSQYISIKILLKILIVQICIWKFLIQNDIYPYEFSKPLYHWYQPGIWWSFFGELQIYPDSSSWGQHGADLGPVGPRWAPCWPHEPLLSRQFMSWGSRKFGDLLIITQPYLAVSVSSIFIEPPHIDILVQDCSISNALEMEIKCSLALSHRCNSS